METSTGLVSEARKMRVSFLVLIGVIAVCNSNASAKAVAPATEDEANSVGQSPVEQGPQNDTACETAVKKSNIHGGEHILSKRQIIPDWSKRRSITNKKFDKKRKSESKKSKYEEHKTRMVLNKTRSMRKDKYESQGKDRNRRGFVSNNWYIPSIAPKTFSFPVIYDQHKVYDPWKPQVNFPRDMGSEERDNALPPKDILKVQELADIFHNSVKEGLESLFNALDKELNKKFGREDAFAAPSVNMRSACIDTGDGSCESESTDDAFGAVPPSDCSDDTPTTTNESGNGMAQSDVSKRSGDSPLEYLGETLPVLVQAAETILGESVENTKPFGGDEVVADGGMYDRRSFTWGAGDEAVEPSIDYGFVNWNLMPNDYGDFFMNRISAK